jgi:hypothetical protein
MDLKGCLFGVSLTLFRTKYANFEKGILESLVARRVLLGIILYFFRPGGLNLRKGTFFGVKL